MRVEACGAFHWALVILLEECYSRYTPFVCTFARVSFGCNNICRIIW